MHDGLSFDADLFSFPNKSTPFARMESGLQPASHTSQNNLLSPLHGQELLSLVKRLAIQFAYPVVQPFLKSEKSI